MGSSKLEAGKPLQSFRRLWYGMRGRWTNLFSIVSRFQVLGLDDEPCIFGLEHGHVAIAILVIVASEVARRK